MKKLILGIICLVFLAGCDRIERGNIVSKHYEPKKVTTSMILVGQVMVPTTSIDDEDWVIMVKGKTKKGKVVTKRVEVTQVFYNSAKVGDFVNLAGE